MSEPSAALPSAPITPERLIDGAADHAIYVVGIDGRVSSWSAGAEKLKGYRRDEIVGRNYEFFSPRKTARPAGRPNSCSAPRRRAGSTKAAGASARTARASMRR